MLQLYMYIYFMLYHSPQAGGSYASMPVLVITGMHSGHSPLRTDKHHWIFFIKLLLFQLLTVEIYSIVGVWNNSQTSIPTSYYTEILLVPVVKPLSRILLKNYVGDFDASNKLISIA